MTTFIFAGGGSGGHIFPALAINEQLMAQGPGNRSIFICSDRPLDAAILTRERAEYRSISAKPLSTRPRGLWKFLRSWGPSVRAGRSLIGELRAERQDVRIVAMGGFVAAPIAQSGHAEGVPVLLVNLDAVPGKANRLIARRATQVVTAVPVVGPCASLGWTVVPPIVRASGTSGRPVGECRVALGLDPEALTLLVTGGSQGAVSINRTVLRALKDDPEAFSNWQVIHQCGRGEEDEVRRAYAAAGVRAVVQAFFEGMGDAWRASDLAVSRAGAGGVAEAWAYQVPTVFMPNPYHKDQHQRHNAARLVEVGGALCVEDRIEESLNAMGASRALSAVLRNAQKRAVMREALAGLGPADGAAQIARLLRSEP
jgi:UDP-N-acetylglucosamine--N-acetylmuramyl-(pentapeptide) pyrophosphoryl-undecaprenol N-acetylglucosamine transferase